MFEIVALLCCGTFFGASIYINLAQHPATLDAGGDFAGQFFPPMYAKASTLQIALAVLGFLFGLVSWYQSNDILWIIGSLFLISVIPITLFLSSLLTISCLMKTMTLALSKSKAY